MPREDDRPIIIGRSRRYSIIAEGTKFSRNRVGPPMKMKSPSRTAKIMFVLDSHWMPLPMPLTAEAMKATVKTTMMPMIASLLKGPVPPTISTPRPICKEPIPRLTAVPNSVAMMAKMSITLPAAPRACLAPNSGSRMLDINGTRPRR